MAENGILKLGKVTDFQCHMLKHQLGAYTDCNHGQGLAVLHPALYCHIYREAPSQFARLAENVWRIEKGDKTVEETALSGTEVLAAFIKKTGLPSTLTEMGIADIDFEAIANSTILTPGCCKKLEPEELTEILRECV